MCGCPACPTDEAREHHDKGTGTIVLPFYCKTEVYAQYAADFLRHRHNVNISPLKYDKFRRLWKEKFKHLKIAKTKTGWAKCDDCVHWRRLIQTAQTDNLRSQYQSDLDKHLDHQRAQRLKYYKHRLKALNWPDKYICIIMDAMDQAKCEMPHRVRSGKGEEKLLKLKQKLLGVLAHGYGAYVYVAPTPVGSGANFNIEALWRTIELVAKQRKEEKRDGVLPPVLYLQLDNASDNKSKAMIAFCHCLVARGIFRKLKTGFLLVGHTHEDIDQYFSVIARKLR